MLSFIEWVGAIYLLGFLYTLFHVRKDFSYRRQLEVALFWPFTAWGP